MRITARYAPEVMLIGEPLCDDSDKAKAASPITHTTSNDAPVRETT